MRARSLRPVVLAAAGLVVAAGRVEAGRWSVGAASLRADGYRAGHSDGYYAGYTTGLRDGVIQGRPEGHVLQVGEAVTGAARTGVQAAFTSGYAAGAYDVFAGYDGGWRLAAPYLVRLPRARTPLDYRISSRPQVEPGVN